MSIFAIGACVVLLGGCGQHLASGLPAPEYDDANCRAHVAQPGTDAYTRCRASYDDVRQRAFMRQQYASASPTSQETGAAAVKSIGNAMKTYADVQAQQAQAARPKLTCTTMANTTTCY